MKRPLCALTKFFPLEISVSRNDSIHDNNFFDVHLEQFF